MILLMASLFSQSSYAAKKGQEGGGGDTAEIRVNEIRSDLLDWINRGGAKSLILSDISYDDYESEMIEILQPKKVIIGFVEKDDDSNDELKVSVDGVPKTCRGFISKIDTNPHILCNISRFNNTSESDQYKLIHHEYAGLAIVEKNEGAASDYLISSQITSFLKKETVLKLAVKKKTGNSFVTVKITPLTLIGKLPKEAFDENFLDPVLYGDFFKPTTARIFVWLTLKGSDKRIFVNTDGTAPVTIPTNKSFEIDYSIDDTFAHFFQLTIKKDGEIIKDQIAQTVGEKGWSKSRSDWGMITIE